MLSGADADEAPSRWARPYRLTTDSGKLWRGGYAGNAMAGASGSINENAPHAVANSFAIALADPAELLLDEPIVESE